MGTQSGAMRTRTGVLTAACAAAAVAIAGCGSSGSPTSTSGSGPNASTAVVRAADVTGQTSGYRFRATMDIAGPASIKDTMSGTILRSSNTGEINLHQNLLGRSMTIAERFSGRTFWISASGVPDATRLTHKPWLKYNINSTLNQLGLGGLPSSTSSDPSQFLQYLKGVGGQAHKLGSATVDGVPTTHYVATVNLHNYVKRVPSAQRAQATKAVQRLISTIGSDQLHVQVWVDDHSLARRMSLSFPECVADQHLHLSMTVDMYDFGTKANVTLPSDDQSYDITSLVDQQLAHQKLGCTATD
jgi:hypothetical protein